MTEIQPVTRLLAAAGFQGEPVVEPLEGGKNNRAFLVRLNGENFFLKSYFWHPDDRRARLDTEFRFSAFLWSRGIHNIPRPIANDLVSRLGLYAFVEGRKLYREEITESLIQQALGFFLAMNRYRNDSEAQNLPTASEACFSLTEHLANVQKRAERLKNFRETKDFATHKLLPQWERVKKNILQIDSDLLTQKNRCLSPSDFGFHNALLTPKGTLYFHDFEYAGWDDPARMVCDFFCQPELPISMSCFEDFAKKVFDFLENPAGLEKTSLLLPVYRIKWCCIMLNEFLKEGSNRRKFAQKENDHYLKKMEQLAKVETYFEKYV